MTIKKLILVIICFALSVVPSFATGYKACTSLTGGGTGALDAIDGSGLESGDVAVTTTSSATYFHRLDATSGAAESSPSVISPDANAGTKRWLQVGIYPASLQLPTGATITEISTDDTLAGSSDTAVVTEGSIKTYVDTQIATVAAISTFAGYFDRASFAYKDSDEIYINPGRYEHNGTSQQMVYWDSQITFVFGPGGSNAASDALGASDWFYLYLDDSAIVVLGAAVLTSAEFVADTTAPTYSVAKHGWYNGNDRCIGAFRTNASSTLEIFWHDGGDVMVYDSVMTDVDGVSISTTWDDRTLTLPAFATKALVSFYFVNANTSGRILYYRTTGSTSSTGHRVGYARADEANAAVNTMPVMTDTSQNIDLYATGAMTVSVYTDGYFFPRGM